jgi:ABC-type sugar transport system substrate-binding protein
MTRVLVTGSRKWKNRAVIAAALLKAVNDYEWPIIIVHGGQTSWDWKTGEQYGADFLADEIAREVGLEVEQHLPDWNRYGKAAGPLRNQEMVDAGADVCLAFPAGESRGTRNCMRKAEEAGIPVIDYGY